MPRCAQAAYQSAPVGKRPSAWARALQSSEPGSCPAHRTKSDYDARNTIGNTAALATRQLDNRRNPGEKPTPTPAPSAAPAPVPAQKTGRATSDDIRLQISDILRCPVNVDGGLTGMPMADLMPDWPMSEVARSQRVRRWLTVLDDFGNWLGRGAASRQAIPT